MLTTAILLPERAALLLRFRQRSYKTNGRIQTHRGFGGWSEPWPMVWKSSGRFGRGGNTINLIISLYQKS